MKHILSLLLLLFLSLSAKAEIIFIWSSHVLVPGESVYVYVIQNNGTPLTLDRELLVKNGSCTYINQGTVSSSKSPSGRAFAYLFECTANFTGNMEIPAFTVKNQNGTTETTKPQSIPVIPFDKIKWTDATYGKNQSMPFGFLWYPEATEAYINQPLDCVVKLYVPDALSNVNVPLIESDGLAIGDFRTPLNWQFGNQEIQRTGTALLKGKQWNSYCFSASITPIKQGIISAGPGTIDATTMVGQVDPRYGVFHSQLTQVTLPLSKLLLNSKPLPTGAPAGFSNAVGNFHLTTETAASDIIEGEPISVTIKVKGTGNLNILDCPRPEGEENWKIYPPNKLPSHNSNQIEFQLLMRPLREVSEIPSFKLVFFDPVSGNYNITKSEPIPLKWKALSLSSSDNRSAPTPPPAGIIPVEEMTDILYTADSPASFTLILSSVLAGVVLWPWMLIPALVIMGLGIALRVKYHQKRNLRKATLLQQLSSIKAENDSLSFIRSLGGFIESEIPEKRRTKELNNILRERDNIAYLPNQSDIDIPMDTKRKMLKAVQLATKKLPLLILSCCLLLSSSALAQTAADSFLSGDYKKAEQLIAKEAIPSNNLDKANYYYLKGNIDYKSGKSGQAALNYHRSLQITPDHYEARRNLAFIERKEGSLTHTLSTTEDILSIVPFIYYRIAFLVFLSVTLTIIAYMWAFRERGAIHWIFAGLSLILLGTSSWAALRYPDNYNPIMNKNLFIITASDASGWHAAAKTSKKIFTKLPPASVAKVLQTSGSWLYVEFATGSRAWILKDSGEYITP